MLSFLKSIITFMKGSSAQVLIKLFGMIGIRILEAWAKKQEEKAEAERRAQQLEEGAKKATEFAGKESEALSSAMEEDERIIEMHEASSLVWLKEQSKPSMISPQIVMGVISKGTPFVVETKNILSGTPVFADKKWRLGVIDAKGKITLKLMGVGKRTVDVLLQDDPVEEKRIWISMEIEVVEPTPA